MIGPLDAKQGTELQEIDCRVYLVFSLLLSEERLRTWFGEKAPEERRYEPDEDLPWSSLMSVPSKRVSVDEGVTRDSSGYRLILGGPIARVKAQLAEYSKLSLENGVNLDTTLAHILLAVDNHIVEGLPRRKLIAAPEAALLTESEKVSGLPVYQYRYVSCESRKHWAELYSDNYRHGARQHYQVAIQHCSCPRAHQRRLGNYGCTPEDHRRVLRN